jgi:hypothetical protein
MNLLHLPEKYHISILDGGADTCVLGQGLEVLSIHNTRRAHVVGFDHETVLYDESTIGIYDQFKLFLELYLAYQTWIKNDSNI